MLWEEFGDSKLPPSPAQSGAVGAAGGGGQSCFIPNLRNLALTPVKRLKSVVLKAGSEMGSAFPWSLEQGRDDADPWLLCSLSCPQATALERTRMGNDRLGNNQKTAQRSPDVDLRRGFRAGNGLIQCLFSLFTWS